MRSYVICTHMHMHVTPLGVVLLLLLLPMHLEITFNAGMPYKLTLAKYGSMRKDNKHKHSIFEHFHSHPHAQCMEQATVK